MLRRTLGEDIEISFQSGKHLWPVLVDAALLESCIINLANNARDAMPNGGKLSIITTNRILDDDYVQLHLDVVTGDYVMIEVTDTGFGMTQDTLGRIFEPFFTTKEEGKGTGLGLSMVFGFIKQSGGNIDVYSEPGIGTTFRLYLPRAASLTDAIPAPVVETNPGRGERVLAVEDNASMRRVVLNQLRELGYQPVEAASAAEALAILEQQSIDLLFTDVVMPGPMDGVALARKALHYNPDIRILLTSGFPGTRLGELLGPHRNTPRLLSKPYRRNELSRMLREVLDA